MRILKPLIALVAVTLIAILTPTINDIEKEKTFDKTPPSPAPVSRAHLPASTANTRPEPSIENREVVESKITTLINSRIQQIEAEVLTDYQCINDHPLAEIGGCLAEGTRDERLVAALQLRQSGYPTNRQIIEAKIESPNTLETRANGGDPQAAIARTLAAIQDRDWPTAEKWASRAIQLSPRAPYPYLLLYWSRRWAIAPGAPASQRDVPMHTVRSSYMRCFVPLAAASMLGDSRAKREIEFLSDASTATLERDNSRLLIAAHQMAFTLITQTHSPPNNTAQY